MFPRHSWSAVATSAAIHLIVVTVMFTAARVAASTAVPRVERPLTFVSLVPAPDPAVIVPIQPIHLEVPRVEPTVPAVVEPGVEPPPVEKAPEVRRVPEVLVARREVPKPVEPMPLGHAIEPPKPVQMAGFDAPAARSAMPEVTRAKTSVGAFESSAATNRPQAGSDRPNIVADAGFGSATATQTHAPQRTVADAGFGGAAAAKPAEPRGAVKTTDFDAKPAMPAAQAVRQPRVDVPVEVLSKPTPAYTDEARTLKIEGDVILEVEFTARGDVRVLRVVRGLGHGLDESASRAALGITFKPAQSEGHPIDFRTTVHIVFRLA